MKRNILIVFGIILLMNLMFVSSQDSRFYHEQNQNLTLYEKCRVNGGSCNASYTCNLTVINPIEQKVISNGPMNYGIDYYNYTILSQYLSEVGEYESTVDCSNGILSGSNTFYFSVNPIGGKPLDDAQGNLLIVSGLLLIILSLFCAYIGFRAINPFVSITLIAFSVLILVFSIGFMLNVMTNSLAGFDDVISNYSTVFTVLVRLLIGLSVGFILYFIVSIFKKINMLRGVRIE